MPLSFVVPTPGEIVVAAGTLVLPQIPITIGNAFLATALLAGDLYQRPVEPRRLSLTIGLMNLTSVPFGGFPMCHGAGGLAAQYRFGARGATANVMAGLVLITVAICFSSADLVALLPTGIFGALLVFDEVISGFRVGPGGAQARFGVRPDMTCLGKIAGGGLPRGVYGGRADIMKVVAPDGPVYQAGTLSGNPLAMAAGLAVLQHLDAGAYERLEKLGARLEAGVTKVLAELGIPACFQRVASAFTLFFQRGPVTDFATASQANRKHYADFFHGMLARGCYLPPAQLECAFVSLAHSDADIDSFVRAAQEPLAAMADLR